MPVDSLEAIQAAIAVPRRAEGKSISIAGGRHAMGGQQFGSKYYSLGYGTAGLRT